MRTVTFGVASSLDNSIARKDHGIDWLKWNDEIAAVMKTYWKTIDTVVCGRKTYDLAVKHGNPAYPGVMNYVLSRTLKQSPSPKIEIVAEDAVAFVRKLKGQKGKGICIMSGGQVARPLLEADLVDEVGFNIHPVLLGAGVPLFYEMPRQIDLTLLECKTFQGGCVYVRYRVEHQKSGAPSSRIASDRAR